MFYGSEGLSIASPTHYSSRYMASDQFHTPNFGDEFGEFIDIPPIALPHSHDPNIHHMSYSHMHGMHGVNQGQHHHSQQQQQHQHQQQHYSSMYLPEHMATPMTMNSPVSYGGSPPTYTNLSSPHPPSHSPMGNPHMMHHPQQQHGARPPHPPTQSVIPLRRSPSNNSSVSPANPESHSEDSEGDSVQGVGVVPGVMGAGKRPSPEPERTMAPVVVAAPKKPKAQKKKKKRDPNEPQKPVSAYALFFRDTQAAIKGQNPSASFGEVSKIVASMWDALDVDHKNVYKKKTEAAKKEYLKQLAAYRASLVSKGAPTDSPDGMYPPPSFNQSMSNSQHYQQQPPQSYYGNQPQGGQGAPPHKKSPPAPQQTQVSTMAPPNQQPTHVNQQQSGHSHSMQQMGGNHHLDSQHSQQPYGHGGMGHNPAYMNSMGDGHGMANASNIHPSSGGGHGQMNPGSGMNPMVAEGQNHSRQNMCVRNGCKNVSSNPTEADMQGYDEGYCSSQCVVTHCRDVFTNWVSTNQSGNPNYGSGMKYTTPASSTVVGPDGLSYVT